MKRHEEKEKGRRASPKLKEKERVQTQRRTMGLLSHKAERSFILKNEKKKEETSNFTLI